MPFSTSDRAVVSSLSGIFCFDAHYEDEMAGLGLTDDDYAWVSTKLRQVAEQFCNGHIISMLEGGYALSALGRSVVAHIKALL